MRGMMITLTALVAFSCWTGNAEEMISLPLLNGVFSVVAPEGWLFEQNENGLVTATPRVDSPFSIVFFPPNPDVEGNIGDFADVVVGLLRENIDDGELVEKTAIGGDGEPGMAFLFIASVNGIAVQCVGHVIGYGEYGVLCLAVGPESGFDAFFEEAAEMVASYEIDPDALRRNADLLQESADRLGAELRETFR